MRMRNRHAVALVAGRAGRIACDRSRGDAAGADRRRGRQAVSRLARGRPRQGGSRRDHRRRRAAERQDAPGPQRPAQPARPPGRRLDRPAHRHAAPAAAHRRRAQRPARRRPRRHRAWTTCAPTATRSASTPPTSTGSASQRRVSTPRGLTVVHFRQLYRGIPAFDNDVRVAIDRAGRVHSVAGLAAAATSRVASVDPSLSGAEALARLQKNVGVERSLPVTSGPSGARHTTNFKGGDFARLVLFGTAGGAKLAWHVTYRATSTALYDAVVDAASGAVLYRQNLVKAAANAQVYPNHPGDERGRDGRPRGLRPAGRLDQPRRRLVHAVGRRRRRQRRRRGGAHPPSAGTDFVYPFTPVHAGRELPRDASPARGTPRSATRGRRTATRTRVQAFYLVSRFHDHLAGDNVAFTDDSGNFEVGGTGGDDPVLTQTDDGADTEGDGGPDVNHKNNANMAHARPTASRRRCRCTCSRTRARSRRARLPQHERRRRLRRRVARVHARPLQPPGHQRRRQRAPSAPRTPGAMGEAWSDWYASDLQVADGIKTDALGTPAEIDVGDYSDVDPHTLRTPGARLPGRRSSTRPAPAARPPASAATRSATSARSPARPRSTPTARSGPRRCGTCARRSRSRPAARTTPPPSRRSSSPTACGSRRPSRRCSTCATRSWPPSRSTSAARSHDLVWDVFRKRGMGYFAATADGADTRPVEDFLPPPDPNGPKGTVTGVVTDSDSGLPIAGVRGRLRRPRLAARVRATTSPTRPTRTAATRSRACRPGPTRSSRSSRSAGYDPGVAAQRADRHRRDDDAQHPAGARLGRPERGRRGPDRQRRHRRRRSAAASTQAFDQSQGTGWSAYNPASEDPGNPHAGPPTVVVELPETIDISGFLIDPSAGCGDGASATTREYTVETSADGTTFQLAVDGRGAAGFTDDNIGLLNRRNPTGTTGKAVKFVRLTMLSPLRQGDDCLPTSCSGTRLHRHDGVQGPGRPSEHAADRLARGQQRRPRRRARRSPSTASFTRRGLGDHRLRLGLRRQRDGRSHHRRADDGVRVRRGRLLHREGRGEGLPRRRGQREHRRDGRAARVGSARASRGTRRAGRPARRLRRSARSRR